MSNELIINKAIIAVKNWCIEYNIPKDQGIDHALNVMQKANTVIPDFGLTNDEELIVLLSCLLHDIEDCKFVYPSIIPYQETRRLLENIGYTQIYGQKYVDLIIKLIGLIPPAVNILVPIADYIKLIKNTDNF